MGIRTKFNPIGALPNSNGIAQIACSGQTTWLLKPDGTLFGCGYNFNGQQGNGNTSNVLTFTKKEF